MSRKPYILLIEVVNVPKDGGFNLPITGTTGLLMASLGGLALATGGIIIARRNFKTAEN